MADPMELALQLLILPAGLAWGARKIARTRNRSVGAVIVLLAPALPWIWLFYESQQADAITRAAAIFVTPFFYPFMLIPAALGYSKARPKSV